MNIQKFEGNSEQEVMNRIKEELGSDAVILNVRNKKSNWFTRLFKINKVEITVATENKQRISNSDSRVEDLGIDELKDQIVNMERLLESTAGKMDDLYKKSNTNYKNATILDEDNSMNKYQKIIFDHLVKQEVEEEVALDLIEESNKLGEDAEIEDIIRVVYKKICRTIGDAEVIKDTEDRMPELVFFIGPTGVGKTTTIAKLTADFNLKKEKDVALITADTYRIAAIDQLKTYSDILSVPLRVVYTPEELEEAVEELKAKEFIFIDTAGRSHKNDEHLGELKDMLDRFKDKRVYLVLSATTKFSDLRSIIDKYSKLCGDYSIIITKTDETASAGTILNLRYYTGKTLSYVSFGQNVPDDIGVVEGAEYAKILLGSLSDD